MIVDAAVSVDSKRYPIERALEVLSRSKIERAVIFADAHAEDLERENRYVLEAARKNEALFPFFYLGGNPWTDTRPDQLEIPDNLDDYAGIRWHWWVGEDIDRTGVLDEGELEWAANLMESAEFEALTAAAAHYDLPVIFEESFTVTLEFVLRYPSLDIIVPHLGARSGGESRVLRELWDQPNVYFDTSLGLLDESILTRLGVQRLLFGSAYPYGDPEVEVDKIDRLPVAEDIKERVYSDNMLSLLSSYSAV